MPVITSEKFLYINGVKYTMPTPAKSEEKMQEQVVSFIRNVYDVKTKANAFNGGWLPGKPNQIANLVSKNRRAGGEKYENDLDICHSSRGYGALALELKLNPHTVFLKGGGFTSNSHAVGQAQYLEELNASGWLATFAEGFLHAVNIIKWYMDINEPDPLIETLITQGKCKYTGAPVDVKVLKFTF